MTDLGEARRQLVEAIGENSTLYFHAMRMWFREKISKEEFDSRALQLLSPAQIQLHNKFFLALLEKCHIRLWEISDRAKLHRRPARLRQSHPVNFEKNFQPQNDLRGASISAACILPPASLEPVSLSVVEGLLPDFAMTHARAMLVAWESGLDGVHEHAVSLILTGVEQILKNVIHAVICLRRSRLVRDGKFPHLFGAQSRPAPYRIPAGTKPLDGRLTTVQRPLSSISSQDLLDAIEMHKGCIPNTSTRNALRERLFQQL